MIMVYYSKFEFHVIIFNTCYYFVVLYQIKNHSNEIYNNYNNNIKLIISWYWQYKINFIKKTKWSVARPRITYNRVPHR